MAFWVTSCHYTDSHVSYECIKKQNHTTKTAEKEKKRQLYEIIEISKNRSFHFVSKTVSKKMY